MEGEAFKEFPAYIIIMTDEVEKELVNEEVRKRLFKFRNVNVATCGFGEDGEFYYSDV